MSLLVRLGGATTRFDEFGRWVNTQIGERGERVIHAGLTETGAWIFESTPALPPDVFAAIPAIYDFSAQVFWAAAETEDYQADSSLDVVAALFPPAPPEPIETFAAQPHYGDQFETYIAEETQDYQADSTLETLPVSVFNIYSDVYGDCVPILTDAMLVSAQPSFADDLATYVPIETEDYVGAPEQLEFLAPPEIRIPELIPSIEFREQAWFPDQETEDYGPDSTVEVPQLYPATAAEPVETFASQPLAEQWFFPADEIEDYLALPEQVEFLAPPEVPSTELVAAQPHYGEAFWPEAETEDYQQDSSLDITSTFFPFPLEPDETFAAQPHYGEWFWEATETEDYIPPDEVSWLLATPLEAVVSGYDFHPEVPEAETLHEYEHTATVDLAWFLATPLEAIIGGYDFHPEVPNAAELTVENDATLSTDLTFFVITLAPHIDIYITDGDPVTRGALEGDGGVAGMEGAGQVLSGIEG